MSKKIAVVGYAFRFPGTSADLYWEDLLGGRDLVSQVEAGRWSREAYLHPKKSHPGTSYTFAAGSLGDVSGFDAAFFGISPREAAQMDPQQRLLLELSWEAFENAGVKPSEVRGSRCGVFVGIASADYSYRFADDLGVVDSGVATGNTASIAANRISYLFDLRGPSMAIDTACSSSLVAFHQACRSIASGETTQALVGGISLHLHPYGFVVFSKASMLSQRGLCNVFDASGDGYVRSEGGGVFFLKDYAKAVADGDRIVAVVAASAVNTDGRKSGLTVPSAQAQAGLLREAYALAGIDPVEIDYIEAHGTGTAIGDPIETRALGEALGQRRSKGEPLLIGSVKSNLGHLEAASGVAGLVKAIHCLQHREVPATIHLENPNPKILFDEWNLQVVRQNTPLKREGRLVVGVNSFGFGGANAHVVLVSPEPAQEKPARVRRKNTLPVVLSAKSDAAVREAADRVADLLESGGAGGSLYEVAYNLCHRRERHEQLAVIFGSSEKSVAKALRQYSAGGKTKLPAISGGRLHNASAPAFVYSGNGSQWEGMGQQLLADPTFLAAVREVDSLFRHHADYSLEDELAGRNGSGRYERTEIAQPALFAIQVGLTAMLRARGVMPAAVAGHSVGEVAAAWACGALTLAQAVQVIFHRSAQQGKTKGLGQMCAVSLNEGGCRELLAELGLSADVAIAGVNSGRGVTVAGEATDLEKLEAALAARKTAYKRLDLDYAFHSPAMDAIEAGVLDALADLRPGEADIPFHSAVTGRQAAGGGLDGVYWWRNIRKPVLFYAAVESMLESGINLFVEVGPHVVLRGYINEALRDAGAEGRVVPTLARGNDAPDRIWEAVGQLMVAGAPVAWEAYFPTRAAWGTLPNYPWQRERHWHEQTSESLGLLQRHKVHPLLGYRLAQKDLTWENQLDVLLNSSLKDHVVGDATIFPGTGYAEMALAAAQQWHPADGVIEIADLEIQTPLLLGEEHSRAVRLSVDPGDGSFTVRGREYAGSESWTVHAVGRIPGHAPAAALPLQCPSLPGRAPDFDGDSHHSLTSAAGLAYGPAYRAIDHGWVAEGEVLAVFRLPAALEAETMRHHLHPALLDCAFQLIIHLLKDELDAHDGVVYVPTRIGRLICHAGQLMPHVAQARLLRRSPHSLTVEFSLFDAAGARIAWVHEARFRGIRVKRHNAEHIRLLGYHNVPQPHYGHGLVSIDGLFEQLVSAADSMVRACVDKGLHRRYAEEVEPLLDSLCHLFAKGAGPADDAHGEATAEAVWNGILADYPDYFPLLHAVGRAGLHRENSGHSLVAADLWPALAGAVLGQPAKQAIGRSLQQVIEEELARLPAGQRFRIVEVGSAAPLFAPEVCRGLDFDRCDYVLASTPDNLEACQRVQEHFPRLTLQGHEDKTSGFHLAIVTGDLGTDSGSGVALDFAERVLSAAGVLIFAAVAPASWMDFVFAGDKAWWLETSETERISRHRPAAYWRREIEGRGLCDARVLKFGGEMESGPYLVVAKGSGKPIALPATSGQPAGIWVLVSADHPLEQTLAAKLAGRLEAAGGSVVHARQEVSAEDFESLFLDLKSAQGSVAGVIHLRGMGDIRAADFGAQLAAQVDRCALAAAIAQACETSRTDAALWLLTANGFAVAPSGKAADAALWGFGRTLMNEASNYSVRLLDLQIADVSDRLADAVAAEILDPDSEQEAMLAAGGERFAPRLRVESMAAAGDQMKVDAGDFHLAFQFPGQLRNLRWETCRRRDVGDDEVEIAVHATGLNFRDVMYALGLLSDEAVENGFAGPTLGLECAGVVTAVGSAVRGVAVGDRVVAFGPSCFSNRVVTKREAVALIPGEISFEAAATIPSTFFTAYYALHHLARLEEGERVLIHGAAGGVGIAAIQIAKWLGAEIFATAGSDEKRDFLRLLGVDHVFDSRSLGFADEILAVTGGGGIDVVLNSLAGEAVNRNLRVLRPFGRFLELGKRDFYGNTKIGLRPFRNNISYFGIDADQLMAENPRLTGRLFGEVMALFAAGTLHPLPYSAFEADDVVDAFRHMQQARQIGKIVVTYGGGVPHLHAAKAVKPSLRLDPAAAYLVTGGLRGFGLRTAQWLVEKGARYLILVSRSGLVEGEAKAAIAGMEAVGVRVLAAACDVTDEDALAALFKRIEGEFPPLRGVVHAAVVIDDGLVRGLDRTRIERVLAPKIRGAMNLDRLTRGMPLDFFVLFSSATTLFGNPGQSSYVAANAWLEAFAEHRRAAGLPALCVCWGAIDDAGFLARHTDIKDALQGRMGGAALKASVALEYLEALMVNDRSGLGLLDLDWKALSRFLPTAVSPKFGELALHATGSDADEDRAEDIQRLLQELSDEELLDTMVQMLKEEVGEILRIDPAKIDPNRSIYDMGLDSLMGVELVTAVESRFGVRLPVMALSESPSVGKLAEKLVSQLRSDNDQPSDLQAQVEQVVAQHGAEVGIEAIEDFVQEVEVAGGVGRSRMIH